jgi:predicted rRNA methylase YqxC with S4 and FtsJ domains
VDARDAKALASCLGIERFDLVSVDVSNALLEEVLPQVAGFLKPGGLIVALFKPPYQADRRLDSQQDV